MNKFIATVHPHYIYPYLHKHVFCNYLSKYATSPLLKHSASPEVKYFKCYINYCFTGVKMPLPWQSVQTTGLGLFLFLFLDIIIYE